MKKSINDFQIEKLEDRKEFIFYCLLHFCCKGHQAPIDPVDPSNPSN